MTRVQQTSPLVRPAERSAPRRLLGRVWLSRFCIAFVAVVMSSYFLVEALELRFCQPFRCDHMNKVLFFQKEVRDPSVVFMGTSQMHMGVMPAIVELEAAKRGKPLGTTHNLSVPGADLELSWIVARDTLTGRRRPKVLVVGVFPLIMAADRRSPAAEYVTWYGSLSDVAGHVFQGDAPVSALLTTPFRGLQNLIQYPLFRSKKPILCFRWEYLRQCQGGWWLPEDVAKSSPVPHEEWERGLAHAGEAQNLVFRDDSRPAKLLLAFRDLASERGMKFHVVYPPQHPDFNRVTILPGCESNFHTWINDFCSRNGIAYHDLSDPEHHDNADYHDVLHLNARGAERFSRRLADMLTAELAAH
jgi:hypothetical protein